MADAYKCDRCGVYYENNNFGYYGVTRLVKGNIPHLSYDLCDECIKSFEKWLKEGE